jgi:SAM-dependent methyltransferase
LDESLLLSFERLEQTHWWFVVRRRIVGDLLDRHAPRQPLTITEVGSGTGGFLAELRARYPSAWVRGFEPNEAAVAAAARSGAEVSIATLEALPVDTGTVDMVIALDVLEHCPDDHVALAEACRVLRRGGTLVLTVPALPCLWSVHDTLNHHHRRYRHDTLATVLERAGFRVCRLTYFNALLLPAAWAVRAGARLARSERSPGVRLPPKPVNAALEAVFSLERRWLKAHDIPIGLSLAAVAERV